MTTTNETISKLENLLARVHPATRTSLDDAKIAAEEMRNVARNAGWLGNVIDRATGKLDANFVAHIAR